MQLRRRLAVWHSLAPCLMAGPGLLAWLSGCLQSLADLAGLFIRGVRPQPAGSRRVGGEGKQSWHKTTPRCSILASSLCHAGLLLEKTNCHSLTHCWGIVTQKSLLLVGGAPYSLFSPLVCTQASQLIRLCPSHFPQYVCGYICCNCCKPRQALEEQASEAGRELSAAGTALNCQASKPWLSPK